MITREEYTSTIERCVRRNLPFVLFMPPGIDEVIFFADTPDEEGECRMRLRPDDPDGFFINFFGNDEPYLAGVRFVYDYAETLSMLRRLELDDSYFIPADVTPSLRSTSKIAYTGILRNIIPDLRRNDSKLVISQMTVALSRRPVGEVMWEYFDRFPDTFRFLCYTPETGMWLGASPEVLAICGPDEVATMSLAGTRPADSPQQWDEKNFREHDLVTAYITERLEDCGLKPVVDDYEELRFGPVVHLCNMISAKGSFDAETLLYTLSPTPALAGYPDKARAVEMITRYESHSRYCYGGFVGFKAADRVVAYVNLRSALVAQCEADEADAYIYNIYAGGGILGDSDVEAEWDEAMRKCAPLRDIVSGPGAPRINSLEDKVIFRDTASRKDFIICNMYGKE